MKRFLVLSGVVLLLAVAGAALFLLMFDANRYRPVVVEKLETALGGAVQLEGISLRWHSGIAAELKGLAVYANRQRRGQPALQAGRVIVQLRVMPLLRGEIPEAIRRISVRKGTVHIRDSSVQPPLELTLEQVSGVAELDLRAARLEFRDFTAQAGGGGISAEGGIRDFYTRPKGSVRVKTQGIALEQLAPGARPAGQPSLQGRMSSALELSFEGTPGPEFLRSVSGRGSLQLQEARLVEMNLLREVFNRVSILPGLTETLLWRLPPSYQKKLNTPDTHFGPVDVEFSLSQGLLSLGDLKLTSDSFELTGSGGKVGLDGRLEVLAQIRIEPELSEAFIKSVEELKYLTDEKQQIVIPLLLQGTLQRLSVAPDLQYLTSKLLATRAEDLVGDLLTRVLEKNLKKEERAAQ